MINRTGAGGRVIIPLAGWAIGVLVALLVGLPLAAVWWSRRAFWMRLRPGRERDPLGDTARRHGLGPAAIARVEDAVLWGKRLEDPAERAAVVDLARAALPRRPAARPGTVVVALVVAWICLAVAGAVWATVEGRWDDVPWVPILLGLLAGASVRGPARALRRNSDQPLDVTRRGVRCCRCRNESHPAAPGGSVDQRE